MSCGASVAGKGGGGGVRARCKRAPHVVAAAAGACAAPSQGCGGPEAVNAGLVRGGPRGDMARHKAAQAAQGHSAGHSANAPHRAEGRFFTGRARHVAAATRRRRRGRRRGRQQRVVARAAAATVALRAAVARVVTRTAAKHEGERAAVKRTRRGRQ